MIGIDLGGTNLRVALVAPEGRVLNSRRVLTPSNAGLGALLDLLEALCRELAAAQGRPVASVGIGIPGLLAVDGTVRQSPNLPLLDGAPLGRLLGERLGCPVMALNDADAIALGEARYGAGRDFESFLLVTLGTGVGGSLILNRTLWHGAPAGAAGEFGHITVVPEGRRCGCGNHGCLEAYASATGIVRSVCESVAQGKGSVLAAAAEDGTLTAAAVAVAARGGDAVAQAALQLAARLLGQALAGVVNLLNPHGVVFAGGASNSFDLLHAELVAELLRRSFVYNLHRLPLVTGRLGDDAGVIGAAEWAGRTGSCVTRFSSSADSLSVRTCCHYPGREQHMVTSSDMDSRDLYRLIMLRSPEKVLEEVTRLFVNHLSPRDLEVLQRSYNVAVRLYRGDWPGYQACNTEYHSLFHASHTFLALARMLHGAMLENEVFTSREVLLALSVAVYHDAGYLQESGDTGSGAKYTCEHVARGVRLFRALAPEWGIDDNELATAEGLFWATDLATRYDTIDFASSSYERLGKLLDTADLTTQMSDRAYLEKLLFLFHEFREAGITSYESEADLLHKTLDFYAMIERRLAPIMPVADRYLRAHFAARHGITTNPYEESIVRQKQYLQQILQLAGQEPQTHLKREGIVQKVRERFNRNPD